MSDALLAALQFGDSLFPGGGASFSWGFETLHADGRIANAGDLQSFIEGQLRLRWATCDRPALVEAYRAGDDLDRVAAIDALIEALALPLEMREGSRRAGGALLSTHARLGNERAERYRERVRAGRAAGHLPVVQGLVWRAAGLDETVAAAVSAYQLCAAFASAAVRLGAVGHVEAQRILAALRPVVARRLDQPVAGPDEIGAFTPAADIAMMRHETAAVRLFSN